jgi:hypothetical protein
MVCECLRVKGDYDQIVHSCDSCISWILPFVCRYGLYHLNDACCEFNCLICKKSFYFFSLNNCAHELLEESLKNLVQKLVMSGEIAKPQVNNICMFFGAH